MLCQRLLSEKVLLGHNFTFFTIWSRPQPQRTAEGGQWIVCPHTNVCLEKRHISAPAVVPVPWMDQLFLFGTQLMHTVLNVHQSGQLYSIGSSAGTWRKTQNALSLSLGAGLVTKAKAWAHYIYELRVHKPIAVCCLRIQMIAYAWKVDWQHIHQCTDHILRSVQTSDAILSMLPSSLIYRETLLWVTDSSQRSDHFSGTGQITNPPSGQERNPDDSDIGPQMPLHVLGQFCPTHHSSFRSQSFHSLRLMSNSKLIGAFL